MKLTILEGKDLLFEMSNVPGKYVKNPHRLPFSFFFSSKSSADNTTINHGLRVKPLFNSEKMNIRDAGVLKLHSDWEFTPGRNDKNVDSKDVKEMKEFFKTYKILFAAVWEEQLLPNYLYDYFRGIMTFGEILMEFEFYEDYESAIQSYNNGRGIQTLEDLHSFITDYNLFNTWDK